MRTRFLIFFLLLITFPLWSQQRPRDLGIKIGVLPTGKFNAITDVPGVKVGHKTLIEGSSIRTGVTAILPHDRNIFRKKYPQPFLSAMVLASWLAARK